MTVSHQDYLGSQSSIRDEPLISGGGGLGQRFPFHFFFGYTVFGIFFPGVDHSPFCPLLPEPPLPTMINGLPLIITPSTRTLSPFGVVFPPHLNMCGCKLIFHSRSTLYSNVTNNCRLQAFHCSGELSSL